MAYYQNTIDELTTLLLRNEMAYNSTIVIGDNSSGKSELLKRLLRKADSQKWYLVDSVNRYFDVSQVFYPAKGAPGIQFSEKILENRLEENNYNLKDTFFYMGIPKSIEDLYFYFAQDIKRLVSGFLGVSLEIKQSELGYKVYLDGIESALSSGYQAVIRIFMEMEYVKDVLYGYSGKRGARLKKLLLETSHYHCMYCFASLKGDRTDLGELEHSIEKTLSRYLENCVPNMAVTCSNCNQSLKRTGEKQRKQKMEPYMKRYESSLRCKGEKCKGMCEAYTELRKHYSSLNGLNLQPFGMKGEASGIEYRLQYDVMNAEFIPSKRYDYDVCDLEILEHHIRQFKLNDVDYKTEALMEFVEDTIEADGKYSRHKNRYSNYIVDLFVEKLNGYSPAEVLKVCEKIYINYQLQHIVVTVQIGLRVHRADRTKP